MKSEIYHMHEIWCVMITRQNLSNVGLPAWVLLGAGVPLKQSCLVGDSPRDAPAAVGDFQNRGDGRYGAVAMVRQRDLRHQGREAVYLGLRDGGQERTGVRPVTCAHVNLDHKQGTTFSLACDGNFEMQNQKHRQVCRLGISVNAELETRCWVYTGVLGI